MNIANKIPNLDKILRDDDESDLMPAAGANLAAIFGSEAKRSSLSYSPTKQIPKNLNTTHILTQTISNKTEVIIAKAVYAFKFENGFYISVTVEGKKIGVALTRNLATKVYQIILYISKEKYVSVATVTHDFSYIIQPNNYSHYYDSNKKNWSILFENNDVCIEFAREVALARYFSKNGKIENVLYQDLSPVNKDVTVKEGDSISIKYLIVTDITQPIKNIPTYQTMTVEISADDNWERALLESNKGSKRILFVPPNKQISLGPGFPKEKDILLEVEIIDIQTFELAHLHKTSSDKASIISRMAKMGQSILPKLPSSTTDSEDTEDDMPHKSSYQKKIESSQEELQKEHFPAEFGDEMLQNSHQVLKLQSDESAANIACKSFVKSSVFTPQWSPSQVQPNFVTMGGQIYTDIRSLQSQTTTSTLPTIIDPGLNMLLSETRITNAELRMGMSKIADNVQKVLDKFHVLELQNATSPTKNRMILDDTLKMLSMNVTEEKDSQSQNISNIATDNFTQLIEMKERISILEKELNQSKEQIKDLETQKESLIQTNENLHKTIKELEISLKDTNTAFSNVKKDLEEATKLNNKYEEKTMVLENKMLKLSEGCAEQLTNSKEINENDNKKKEIKCIMNKIYHALLDKFIDEYSVNYIRTIIADTIKNVTLQVLYNSDETNDDTELKSNIETEVSKTDNMESKVSGFVQVSSILQNEPPPIPPIDTEDDEWLH